MELKVAMVAPYFVHCGIATYTQNLNDALAKAGCEVYGVRLPRFGTKNDAVFRTVAEAVPNKVDIIHVQHEYGLYVNLENKFYQALKQLNKPLVTTMHAVGAWEVDKEVANNSNKVIVHNKFCAKRFDYPNRGIIPHGCSPMNSPPPPKETCKESLQIDPRTPIVGYLGFISNYKGLETLIEAMSKAPKTALLIGGGWHTQRETEYIFQLKEYTLKVLPKRCRWLGFVSDEDMSRVYGAMDVFVYPSRFATESGALITALAHHKAVIASNLPPFKEKEQAGALTTFKNVKDLTTKIKRLMRNPEQRLGLEEGAKRYCEETSWTNVAAKHVALYNSII